MDDGKINIRIRYLHQDDEPFIYATWLRQLWYSKDTVTLMSKQSFMQANHRLIERTLKEDAVMIACLGDDPGVILGYAAFKQDPYIYIKKAWRGLGIEDQLYRAITR